MAKRKRVRHPKGPRLEVVPRPGRAKRGEADADAALEERLARVRRGLYELHSDLVYFVTSPAEHRDRLREALEWPDVGHITSLARALVEEDRFADWVRFNRYVKSA
ncbi:MAG: hypothetical protein ACYS9X_21345 [Planctomycetota bacterium]|jgi:hypothetical protein